MKERNPAKELYQRLRQLSCEELWEQEVPAYDRAAARERMERVAVIRAVGVVFAESGTPEQREHARRWLVGLLDDPEEKVRRYAMTALPKIGTDAAEEHALHGVLARTSSDRERKSLARTLEKVGGEATLKLADELGGSLQKVRANLVRAQEESTVQMEGVLQAGPSLRIHLRGRSGLEEIIEDELYEYTRRTAKFQLVDRGRGWLAISPTGPFSLAEIYALRCFSTASIVLGRIRTVNESSDLEALAKVISSRRSQEVFEAFTDGPIRYRLEYVSKGHQRSFVRRLAERVFGKNPRLLNDSREVPWQIDLHPVPQGISVELTPRLRPDPRFAYRQQDVPAASHPPLAACLARLAGEMKDEAVWDPFCGSGLELIESALRGGVTRVIGTDLSEEAIAISETNLAAALAASQGGDGVKKPVRATFQACDFRDYDDVDGLRPGAVSLVITNPPLGRRVPIPDLREMISDLFAAAATVLETGGRLVLVNPLPVKPSGRSLRLEYRQKVDLGGFHCHLEKYVKP